MPVFSSGDAVSSGPISIDIMPLPPGDAAPYPMPILPAGLDGGFDTRLRMVSGTDDDDRLDVGGGAAFGGEGNDVFVLSSIGEVEGPEHLGLILDFQAGDSLDLSQLGDQAAILGETEAEDGALRISIDYDGDGAEDGFVLAYENGVPKPDDTGVVDLPFPVDDGEFHILPFPMPGDDGVMTILPYPMPGDGEVTILPVGGTSDWIV